MRPQRVYCAPAAGVGSSVARQLLRSAAKSAPSTVSCGASAAVPAPPSSPLVGCDANPWYAPPSYDTSSATCRCRYRDMSNARFFFRFLPCAGAAAGAAAVACASAARTAAASTAAVASRRPTARTRLCCVVALTAARRSAGTAASAGGEEAILCLM